MNLLIIRGIVWYFSQVLLTIKCISLSTMLPALSLYLAAQVGRLKRWFFVVFPGWFFFGLQGSWTKPFLVDHNERNKRRMTCMYIYRERERDAYIYMRICIYICVCMCVYVYVCMYVYVYACMYACSLYVCMCACVYACMYIQAFANVKSLWPVHIYITHYVYTHVCVCGHTVGWKRISSTTGKVSLLWLGS